MGDLYHDGKVSIRDVMGAALAFYSHPGHSRWNPVADIDKDDVVTIIDIVLIVQNLGKTS